MLKSFVKLVVLLCLSTVLTYLIVINEAKLLRFWSHLIADEQAKFTEKTLLEPEQIRTVELSSEIQVDNHVQKENSEGQQGFQCVTTPLEKITEKKQDQIFRWKDDNGKVHFGDSSFQNVATQQVRLKRRKELDYFNLKMSGDEQSTQFSDELSTRITKVYQLLSSLIPKQKLEKVTVDLKIFNHANEYQRYSRRFDKNLAAKADGYYLMRYNQAVVKKKNDAQAGQVALHESAHVINAGIFGYIPRWLDEGIAEYIENMTVTGQAAQIQPNSSWIRRSRIKANRLVSFSELFSAKSSEWSGSKRLSYYATSWALIYFLMNSEEDAQWLGSLLSEKAGHRCKRMINKKYIDNYYPGGVYHLQQRFNQWLGQASTLSAHRY